jgi:hypothetical protein
MAVAEVDATVDVADVTADVVGAIAIAADVAEATGTGIGVDVAALELADATETGIVDAIVTVDPKADAMADATAMAAARRRTNGNAARL